MSVGLWLADVIVVTGVLVLTLAVYGVMRLPDTFARIHSASKAAALGVMILLVASFTSAQADLSVRALVVVLFLSITAPVGSHAVARLERACRRGELPTCGDDAAMIEMRKSPRATAGSSRTAHRDRASPGPERQDRRRRPDQ